MRSERDFFWDNAKAILIFFVVFGHAVELFDQNELFANIWVVIYAFHMPLFCFISGYFSKNVDKARDSAFINFGFLYVIFNSIYVLTSGYRNILVPEYVYWYLLSMFFWKISLKDLLRVKFILPISIMAALYVGCLRQVDGFLSVSRTFCFLPFFLMGYFFDDKIKEKLHKVPKFVYLLIVVSIAFGLLCAYNQGLFPRRLLLFANTYNQLDLLNLEGILLRFCLFISCFALSFGIYGLMPLKKSFLTQYGYKTMCIYLFHPYFIKLFDKISYFKEMNQALLLLSCFIFTCLVILILGSDFVDKCYKASINKIRMLCINEPHAKL